MHGFIFDDGFEKSRYLSTFFANRLSIVKIASSQVARRVHMPDRISHPRLEIRHEAARVQMANVGLDVLEKCDVRGFGFSRHESVYERVAL